MAFHSKLRLILLYHLLITLHLSQPGISSPQSSPQGEPVPSPSQEAPILSPSSEPRPASVPPPSPAPGSVPGPNPGPASIPPLSPGPASIPSLSPGPASVPTPSLVPSPGLSPSSWPNPGPSPFSGQAPGPFPFSWPAPGPSPSLGPALGLSLSSGPTLGPALGLSLSSGPTPSISDPPAESDSPSPLDFSPAPAPSTDVDPQVKKICDSTDHPALCLSTVVPLLNGKTDISSVLEVAIRAGAKATQDALNLVKELEKGPGIAPDIVYVLETSCDNSYSNAANNYNNTIGAFPEHDIGTMNSMLSAVITNIRDCDDAFMAETSFSPLSKTSGMLRNMTSNCLAIVSLLDSNP